jgi:putative DNA primase/helicase
MRQQHLQAQIIIAADNDRLDDKPNTGTMPQRKPPCRGWLGCCAADRL